MEYRLGDRKSKNADHWNLGQIGVPGLGGDENLEIKVKMGMNDAFGLWDVEPRGVNGLARLRFFKFLIGGHALLFTSYQLKEECRQIHGGIESWDNCIR